MSATSDARFVTSDSRPALARPDPTPVASRSEVVVIGGGQLARMMQPAAIGLGIRIRLLAEGTDAAAARVTPGHRVGDHTRLDDLRSLARPGTVVTFDHEHVPAEHLDALVRDGVLCRPGPEALRHAQDKAVMRARLDELGVAQPRWSLADSVEAVTAFAEAGDGFPVVVKTPRGGYDGKGVWVIETAEDAREVIQAARTVLVEEKVPFRRELAAQAARRPSGEVVLYPVVESVQTDGICTEVIAPAPGLPAGTDAQARAVASRLATELDVVGMLAVELFETDDGEVLVNELAMRPHNSGHWTIDGARTSQFENHLRAVLDLPLGPTAARDPWTVMVNVLGGALEDLPAQLAAVLDAVPQARLQLYGKDVRPGRKVAHVSVSGDDLETVRAAARRAAAVLTEGV